MNFRGLAAAIGTALALSPVGALAAAYCSDGGPHPDGMMVSDVTFNNIDSTDCYGLVPQAGNPDAEATVVNGLTWASSGDFSPLIKDDTIASGTPTSATFNNFEFTLDVDGGAWVLTWADLNGATLPNLPITLDIVVLYKAGNEMGMHFFDDLVVDDTAPGGDGAGSGQGEFVIRILNNNGRPQGISHLSLLVRENSTTSTSGSSTTGGTTTTTSGTTTTGGNLSEPSSPLALIGLGLALLLLTPRMRTRKK